IVSRLSGLEKPSVFNLQFAGQIQSKAGSSVIEFAFPKDAFLLKQHILFDTILAQVLPTCIGGTSTSGSDSECILMDTESSFSILDFVVFIENFLTSSHPEVTKSDVIDKILSRFHVISARTATECILALCRLCDLMKHVRASLLILDSLTACFGLVPKKELAITQSVFFDLLKHTIDRFSLHCLTFHQLPPSIQDPAQDTSLPPCYHPTQRVLFSNTEAPRQELHVSVFEEGKHPLTSRYKRFSKTW
ncbi:unnamed protein product, partial [Mesocestoides corti]